VSRAASKSNSSSAVVRAGSSSTSRLQGEGGEMRFRRRSRSSSTPASDPFAGLVLYDVDCIPVSLDERKGIALAWDVLPPRRVSPYSGTSEGVPVSRADFERLLPSAARRAFTQTREGGAVGSEMHECILPRPLPWGITERAGSPVCLIDLPPTARGDGPTLHRPGRRDVPRGGRAPRGAAVRAEVRAEVARSFTRSATEKLRLGGASPCKGQKRSGAGVEPTEPWATRPHRF
jgi:hypothetical protein